MQEMQDMLVQSLGQEDPLEKVMGPQSSILAWKIPWAVEPAELQTVGPKRVRHDWVTELTPTEAVLPGAISSLSPDYRSDLVLGDLHYPCCCGYLESFPPFLVLNWNLSREPLFTKDDLRLSQNSVRSPHCQCQGSLNSSMFVLGDARHSQDLFSTFFLFCPICQVLFLTTLLLFCSLLSKKRSLKIWSCVLQGQIQVHQESGWSVIESSTYCLAL